MKIDRTDPDVIRRLGQAALSYIISGEAQLLAGLSDSIINAVETSVDKERAAKELVAIYYAVAVGVLLEHAPGDLQAIFDLVLELIEDGRKKAAIEQLTKSMPKQAIGTA